MRPPGDKSRGVCCSAYVQLRCLELTKGLPSQQRRTVRPRVRAAAFLLGDSFGFHCFLARATFSSEGDVAAAGAPSGEIHREIANARTNIALDASAASDTTENEPIARKRPEYYS